MYKYMYVPNPNIDGWIKFWLKNMTLVFKRIRLLHNQQESKHLILDVLKYQYETDHTPRIWVGKNRQRCAEFECTWGHNR
jgi:hypothetical protein